MNCLAYWDFCSKLGIQGFPLFALYHNGQMVDSFAGMRDMEGFSDYIEEKLELIRPGSRPARGIKLPAPGAKSVDPNAEPDSPAAKDKNPEAGVRAGEKHNEQIAQLATQSATATPTATPAVKTPARNTQGISVPLSAEGFQKLVTTTREPWFIKFYAPWCPHCQVLAPNWQQMAKEMQGILNIGEVNCDVESRLCRNARVVSYPTMYFFRGGERVEYRGLRGLGDLISYAKKAVDVGSGIQDVDATKFKELEEKEEVIFLYFYDHATTSEDFDAMERLTLSLVGHARLVKTNSAALAARFRISTFPRLLVVRDGRPSYYDVLSPKDMRDVRQILSWMQSVWLPIVPEITASNAREVMTGKYVVLGILTPRRAEDFVQSKRELKNAALEWMDKQTQLFKLERQELRDAKQLRIEEAEDRDDQRAVRSAKNMRIGIREDDKKPVGFAWIDGDFWERWIRTTYGIDVENGERVIINDEDVSRIQMSVIPVHADFLRQNRRYWDTAASGASIMASRTSILETIPLVVANPPKLKPKSTIGVFESILFISRTFVVNHPILLILLIISSAVATFVTRRRMIKRALSPRGGILGNPANGGVFSLDVKEGTTGSLTGKVD